MAEEQAKVSGEEVPKSAEAPKEDPARTFTQEEVNRLIDDRLKRERSAREKEEAEKAKRAEIAKLDGEERIKAEHKAEMEKLAAERDQALKANAILKAGEQLAKMGYDTALASTLIGADEEITTANITAFDKAVKAEVDKRVQAQLAKGAPPVNTNGPVSEVDRIKAAMRGGMTARKK